MDASADKRSGPADHTSVSVGEAAPKQLSSPREHPGVTRLRHRRLMAFLQDQGFRNSYNELMNKTRAHMNVDHLCCLVLRGLWVDALEYLDRYLPPPTSPTSFPAQVLRQFLVMHHRFANAVAGTGDEILPRHYFQLTTGRAVSHADLRLRSISLTILAIGNVRANMDWQRVRYIASAHISSLVRSAPELRGLIDLPDTSIKPRHVLPIASGSRRRYVKKKNTGPVRTQTIIRALKSQSLPGIGSVEEAKELLADLLDDTVREGVHVTTYDLRRPFKSVAGPSLCQPMFGTFTEAKTSGTLGNAGTNTALQEAAILQLKDDVKRQLLIVPNGGASPVVSGPGAVVNLGAKLSGVSSG